MTRLLASARRLKRDRSGLAMLEFAFGLPIFLVMSLTGAEFTNYITTRMRISQLALHLADNAARIGSGSQLSQKTISEADIDDLLTGAGLQASELDLYPRGRVIISSLEPVANPNTTNRYKIAWQRCRGAKTSHASTYGTAGQPSGTNITGMGTVGRQAVAPEGGATAFVEVYYEYKPLVGASLAPNLNFIEAASMIVRDRRDLSDDSALGAASTHPNGIYKVAGVTASTC